jgi:hypothetical protein
MNSEQLDTQPELFTIQIGNLNQPVDLIHLEQLAERLRMAFREIVKEITGTGNAQVKLLVQDVQKGSIVLRVQPIIDGDGAPPAQRVARTIINDINALAEDRARYDMSANLLGQYREIVRIGEKAGAIKFGFGEMNSYLGPENRIAFEAFTREQLEAGIEVVGTIETVNIHSSPWTFGLYTKLDRQRVECRFSNEMLEGILHLVNSKTLALVKGEGHFGPVGITARSIVLSEPPVALEFDPQRLRTFRRSSSITTEGESASEAVSRVREDLASYE